MDETTQVLSILIIVLVLVISVIATQFVRRRREAFPLRVIPAYDALPAAVGLSIESNRPLHLALGSSGVGGPSTLLTLAAAELFYQVAQRAAIGDVPPVLTLSASSALPLGQDTLRRAYQARGRLNQFRYSSARWYPNGARSLTYAAAITAMLGDDRVTYNLFVGSFGPELALMMEAGARRGIAGIAASDQLEGQAVAYAFSEHVLIGEEIFAGGAYLGSGASQVAETITLDILRWLLVFGLLAVMVYGLLNRGG